MLERMIKIGIIIIFLLVAAGVYEKHFAPNPETYIEITQRLYKISNQCIFDHYSELLTADGVIVSTFPINEDCEATHLQDVIIKISDGPNEIECRTEAYKLHGVMITLNANACFMESVVLRRVDNGKLYEDITELMRDKNEEGDKDENQPNQEVVSNPEQFRI